MVQKLLLLVAIAVSGVSVYYLLTTPSSFQPEWSEAPNPRTRQRLAMLRLKHTRKDQFQLKKAEDGGDRPGGPQVILLLASVGRSGSSFLGELLASQGNNMYFYEPIRALNHSEQTQTNIQEELLGYFNCRIRKKVLYIGKRPSINVKHRYTTGKTEKTIKHAMVEKYCNQEPLRIVKTIRTRLQWTRRLLDTPGLNLKVIHLVRDPRGTSISMNDVEWDVTNKDMCNRVMEDLNERREMERLYPDRYYLIKYEDLCVDPYHQTINLFHFLRGDQQSLKDSADQSYTAAELPEAANPIPGAPIPIPGEPIDLPKGVMSFLQSHTHVNLLMRKNPWTTVRDTGSIYQKWRRRITQEDLANVENTCEEVLERLGHVFLRTVERARNFNISLFAERGV